jgi:hypothetical protein
MPDDGKASKVVDECKYKLLPYLTKPMFPHFQTEAMASAACPAHFEMD